jgi:hypothetical protein
MRSCASCTILPPKNRLILCIIFSQKLLTNSALCGIIRHNQEQGQGAKPRKKFEKLFKNPLTNP